MRKNHLAISLTINAPLEQVWGSLVDWERQGEWMLATKVWVTSHVRDGIGTRISAFTGVKSLGILDTMEVTTWTPPYLCDVLHTGPIIKGTGRFELSEINPGLTRFDWSEEVLAPRLIFILISPGLYLGVRLSLARFARSFR